MDTRMNFRHSILIYHLTEAYTEVAVKAISDRTGISEKSISLMKPDRWGVKIVLDSKNNFRKVLSLCVVNIHGKAFPLYPLSTDLIVVALGGHINASKVQYLLERYAPVLVVCEVTDTQGASAFRGVLNYPEIPEITQLWTGSKLKISGYDGIEFSISSFCRFCRLDGHFKSQCKNIRVPLAKGEASEFTTLPDITVPDKRKTTVSRSDSSSALANFAKANPYSKTVSPNFAKDSSCSNAGLEKFAKGSNPGYKRQISQPSYVSNKGQVNFTKASVSNSNGFTKYAKQNSCNDIEYKNSKNESFDSKIEFKTFAKESNPGLTKQKSQTSFDSNTGRVNITKASFGNSDGVIKLAKRSSDSKTESENFAQKNSDVKIEVEKFPKGSNPGLTRQQSQINFASNTGLADFTKTSLDSSNGFAKSAKESEDSNIEYENFAKGSSDGSAVRKSDSDMNKLSTSETSSSKALSSSTNMKHLIPPSMQKDIESLKSFFSHCKNFKHLYKSALRYPSGVGILLRQLRQIIKFSKNIQTKSEEEIKFIAWVCLLLSKIQYYHLKKMIQLEPFYVPPL